MRPGALQPGRLSIWLPVAGCVAVTLPRFLLDTTDSIQRMPVPWAAALTAWWCLPLLGLLTTARVAGLSLAATYRNTHSTAAFGIYFMPLYLAAGVGVLLGVEALVVRRQKQERWHL